MNCTEQVVQFDCAGERLVGILATPARPAGSDLPEGATGVIIIVGGPQYRAGSHRQFVLMGRAMAAAGIPTLRFDYRGMGDSTGALMPFEGVSEDIAAAIAALRNAAPQVRRVVLWGLCDGASAALLYCHATRDAAVSGLCLLNPWVRSEASLAKTQVKHYYTQRLLQREFWLKLLRGGLALGSIRQLARSLLTAFLRKPPDAEKGPTLPYTLQMAKAWREFEGPILLVLSGNDYTAKEFLEFAGSEPAWAGAFDRKNVTRQNVDGADHTFSSLKDHRELETLCTQWLQAHKRL